MSKQIQNSRREYMFIEKYKNNVSNPEGIICLLRPINIQSLRD
jgi:hypothetical protein